MDVMLLLVGLVVGLVVGLALGVALGLLAARGRQAGLLADLRTARERERAAEEKVAYVEDKLADRFQTLSSQALDANSQRFLELAEGRFRTANTQASGELEQRKLAVEHLVAPLRDTLARVESQLREFDAGRRTAHAELAKQVDLVRQSSEELRTKTQSLVSALRRPEARGRWGELQLRRVVEVAGMTRYCDFDEQASSSTADGSQRPDMVVRLTGGKNIVVDSKVSLAAYLEAAEAADEQTHSDRLEAHVRHLRTHVDRLSAKSYWAAFSPTPEFVICFIPGEAFLAPALDRDPGLLEYAMARRVHIATPTTLITMLRTAHYAWQQAALSDNARAVFDLGKELHDRLAGMGRHVERLGKALTGAVSSYNQTIGSLESRVMVTARKLNSLEVVEAELDAPRPVEETTRSLSAPELLGDAAEARQVRLVTAGPPEDSENAVPGQAAAGG
ncbi:MAG: DNA recombination protein RmuC [Streptosporangiales bacterium]|nr:DNA recombination protein RmuC [Streptosporangiales bacterium]